MRMYRSVTGALAVGLWLASAGSVCADIPAPPRPPTGVLGMIRDLRLTVLARRALQNDPALAPLNLGVRVKGGVAETWGDVPSDEVARQAVARLEAVQGVVEVQPKFARLVKPVRTTVQVAKPDEETGQLRRVLPAPVLSVASDGRKLRSGASQPDQRTAMLLPPRSLGGKVASAPESRKEVEKQHTNLETAVDRIRKAEGRFAAVPVRVEGNVIILRRGLSVDDDVTDLAQALRNLPGVGEVRLVDE